MQVPPRLRPLQAVTNTARVWTLRLTTLMVKASFNMNFYLPRSLLLAVMKMCLCSTDMPLLKEA